MSYPYSIEEYNFLAENCSIMCARDLAIELNKRFHTNRTKNGVLYYLKSKGLHAVHEQQSSWYKPIFTDEEIQFLRDNGGKMSRKELHKLMEDTFHKEFKFNSIRSLCVKFNVSSPNGDCRFTAETSPRWQKGLSKEEFKSHYTEESYNRMIQRRIESNIKYSIGDEIIRHDIPFIVVNNEFGKGIDHRLQRKDTYVWEQHYGKLSKDDMLLHIDGDPSNCDINNLICIPKLYRMQFAQNDWYHADPEIKKLAVQWCKLHYTVKDMAEEYAE